MIVVLWVFGLAAAIAHTLAWARESLFIERPTVHQRIFSTPASDIRAIRFWTSGLGFCNLFLAVGLVVGLVLPAAGDETVGRTLVLFLTAVMALSGAIGQGVAPLIAFVAALLASRSGDQGVRRSLPVVRRDSRSRCASGASSSG